MKDQLFFTFVLMASTGSSFEAEIAGNITDIKPIG
jgi:hypothetical protein